MAEQAPLFQEGDVDEFDHIVEGLDPQYDAQRGAETPSGVGDVPFGVPYMTESPFPEASAPGGLTPTITDPHGPWPTHDK